MNLIKIITDKLRRKSLLVKPVVMPIIMEKYYFKTIGPLRMTCIEECKVKNNGIMIGSFNCQKCENCIEHQKPCQYTANVDWIKCKVIDKARGH